MQLYIYIVPYFILNLIILQQAHVNKSIYINNYNGI